MPTKEEFFVRASWDEEAGVWYVAESNIPGLSVEAESPAALMEILADVIPELLVSNKVLSGSDALPRVPYNLMLDSIMAGHTYH